MYRSFVAAVGDDSQSQKIAVLVAKELACIGVVTQESHGKV
jgi:hypothetical protein